MLQPQKTILCVDDDPDDREIVCEAITRVEPTVKVIHAENGLAAHNYLLAAKSTGDFPCLVILDINMPVMDGKQTLVQIKSDDALSAIPVVLFSTSNSAIDKMFCAKYGVELITKPSSFQHITTEIKRLLNYCQ